MITKVEEAKHNEQIQMSMKNYINMSWAWTHDLWHGCPAIYPLHHSDQLMLEVEETNHNEEIVNFNKEALISIALDDVVWDAAVLSS